MELMSLSMKVFNKLKNRYLLCTLNDCNELASSFSRHKQEQLCSDKL